MPKMTTTTPRIPFLPLGFISADDWQQNGADMPYRLIFGADRTVTDHAVCVSTHAYQFADGTIASRWVGEAPGMAVINGDRDTGLWPLNSAQARELAAALLAAGDELDALTED